MENNGTRFWIEFTNGYNNASFQAMRSFLNTLNADNYDDIMVIAIHTIT